MAMRAVNLLGQSAQHRTTASAAMIGLIDRPGAVASVWRSSCGALAPRRLSLRQFPSRCGATAPAQSPPLWSIDTSCEDVMGRLREAEKLKNCLGAPLTEEEQRSLVRCLDSTRLGVDTCLVDGLEALRDYLMSYIEAVAVSQADDLELVEGAMLLMEQLSLALGTVTVSPAVRKLRTPTYPATPATSSCTADSASYSTSYSFSASASLSDEGHEELLEGPQQLKTREGHFNGQWQVLVTTGGGWPYGRLQYVPVIEMLDISEDGRTFRLESKAGPLYLHASGELTWGDQAGPEDDGNHHTNHFNSLHLQYHATDFRVEFLGRSLALPPPTPDNELRVFALAPGTALARSTAGGMQLMARPA